MGSKKHKKESKKKKHRSRSRSPLDGEERERKRHRKHKDRKKDRSPDVEEVPVNSHLQSKEDRSRSRSTSAAPSQKDDRNSEKSAEAERSQSPPLEVAEKPAEDGKIKDDLGEFYHKPAPNIAAQKKSDKMREKLEERREKRKMETKLKTTLLTEGSDDEDAAAWIKKSRQLELQKREAEKRAAMLDELDAEFGVGALVAEEQQEHRSRSYAQKHLGGLRVAHDVTALPEERETILTLADKDVLAEDSEDVLVNVNMVDEERYKKNIEERRKAAAGYQAYDEESELAASLGFARPLLSKYDETIDPEKKKADKGFVLGDEAALQASRFREMMRQERLAGGPDKRLESLSIPAPQLASDYMDEHEISAKFKKFKKKGKFRKKPKQEPIDVDDYAAGNAPLHTDDTEILEKVKKEEHMSDEEDAGPGMVLDATAEFCRTLGDIPTYGLAGNRDTTTEIMDFEKTEVEGEPEVEQSSGAWSRVDIGSEKPADLVDGSSVGLAAEPALGAGVAGALQLALSKGYLEKNVAPAAAPRAAHALLHAKHYSLEDKIYGEDDKAGRRERHHHSHGGSEFREKTNFRPNVKLEYADDDGRPLCPKEAFRYLSHKFHGKGPGKNKQEKRIKKQQQEGLMKKMSSTDTPLGTLHMLQQKQKETHSPYIVLSGTKRDTNN
ncbi:unnamed protein product [Colias eurytheme]|nr:unnamed protein product [Colias eurytheme]